MSKLLLIHNSDKLFDTLQPPDDKRPNFYWYTDRFVSHIGTFKYIYIFVINPKEDNVELHCRAEPFDFDALHKGYLHFKEYHEGKHPHYKMNIETGIAMSFSKLTPAVILRATGKEEDGLKLDYEVIKPSKRFEKNSVIRLFKEPYNEIYKDKPLKFSDIPELAKLIQDIEDVLPFKNIHANAEGKYVYDDWLAMSGHENGTWL
ncbi:hypothetical protein KDA08_03270 [Candidatus Saccharibacteria bacterium]|nr:hypothetical protein [Candidatus Saccharibacteria bacterium]